MAIREIITQDNEILRQIAKEVDLSDITKKEEITILIEDMIETVKASNGVGLAAPQVGISERVIVIKDVTLTNKVVFYEMINPTFTWLSFDKEYGDEGCLSVVDKYNNPIHGKVWRHKRINVEWLDKDGKKHNCRFTNPLQSRIIQHEIDHLQGRLFIDYK